MEAQITMRAIELHHRRAAVDKTRCLPPPASILLTVPAGLKMVIAMLHKVIWLPRDGALAIVGHCTARTGRLLEEETVRDHQLTPGYIIGFEAATVAFVGRAGAPDQDV